MNVITGEEPNFLGKVFWLMEVTKFMLAKDS